MRTPGDSVGDQEAVRVLAFHLRGMRWGIEAYSTGVRSRAPDAKERLAVLVGRYDRALMEMAVLLDVAIGSAALTVTNEQLSDETPRPTGERHW
jgi:hypothetical protein